jgi:nucleoporin NUP42
VNPFGPRPAGSAFGITSAPNSSAFSSQPAPQASSSANTNPFNNATTSSSTIPASASIVDPYATLLPPNYLEMLPAQVKKAFEADRFEFSGSSGSGIPFWIPPLEMR